MIRLFDTHAHFPVELGSLPEGVELTVMAVGGSPELNRAAIAANTGFVALGYDRDQIEVERAPIDCKNANAVGEIGLDYHYSPQTRLKQLALFEEQLELAQKLDKPVVIHTREADDDTLACLRHIPARGIIHSFTGSPGFGRKLLDLGFMVSFSGIVTFRAADNVRETAKVVPLERLLVETDSPYLAPVPLRGTPNVPANVYHTAKFLAELKGVEFADFAAITYQNALTTLCPA